MNSKLTTHFPAHELKIDSLFSHPHCGIFGLPKGKVYVCNLENVVSDKSRRNEQRLRALLLIVIVCFVSPVCEDYQVHNYLVQFVRNRKLVDSYSWGAAFLASLYVGIEKYKSELIKKTKVDGNCWPLLVFFCIRIPKLCKGLGISINLEGQKAPLLSHCMKLMKKQANNKVLQAVSLVEIAFSDLKREDINWHVYDKTMLDERMLVDQFQHVTCHAPMIFMYLVAHHRPIFHLRQFQGLDKYVDMVKSVRLPAKKITLRGNSGDTNQDLTVIYKKWIKLWKNRKPVVELLEKRKNIRGGNNTDNSEEESSYNNTDDSSEEESSSDGDSEEDVGGDNSNSDPNSQPSNWSSYLTTAIDNEHPENGGGKKQKQIRISREYFQKVTQALVMRLKQHEETVMQDGSGPAGMRQRDLIQWYVNQQNENANYSSMEQVRVEVTKIRAIIEALVEREGYLIVADNEAQGDDENAPRVCSLNQRILAVAPDHKTPEDVHIPLWSPTPLNHQTGQSENNRNMNTPIRNNSLENSGFRSPRTPEYKRITELIKVTDGPSYHVED